MHTSISHRIHAEPALVFRLAANVQDWPRLLPHYRSVRVLEDCGDARVLEMAARRDVVGRVAIPLRWTSVQRLNPDQFQIDFEHVRGVTRGMLVRWHIERADPEWTVATIRHLFAPRWPVPEPVLHAIVGDYFINGVAQRTLRRLGALAEAEHNSRLSPRAPRQ
jgi:ribosome-associated toxin RatA of RatAB toxin-antitoxin module